MDFVHTKKLAKRNTLLTGWGGGESGDKGMGSVWEALPRCEKWKNILQ